MHKISELHSHKQTTEGRAAETFWVTHLVGVSPFIHFGTENHKAKLLSCECHLRKYSAVRVARVMVLSPGQQCGVSFFVHVTVKQSVQFSSTRNHLVPFAIQITWESLSGELL